MNISSSSVETQKFVTLDLHYGRLYYEDQIPIIQYYTNDPFKIGYTQGVLVGPQMIFLE